MWRMKKALVDRLVHLGQQDRAEGFKYRVDELKGKHNK